jgi:hypothetical protein
MISPAHRERECHLPLWTTPPPVARVAPEYCHHELEVERLLLLRVGPPSSPPADLRPRGDFSRWRSTTEMSAGVSAARGALAARRRPRRSCPRAGVHARIDHSHTSARRESESTRIFLALLAFCGVQFASGRRSRGERVRGRIFIGRMRCAREVLWVLYRV